MRALHFSSGGSPYSLCLRCLCFYDQSTDPSPPLLLTQLRCIAQAVVAAFYLAPASRLPSWQVRWPTQMHKAWPRAPEQELMMTVTSVKSCRYSPPVSSCPSLNQRRDLCSLKGQMPIWQSTVDAAWWDDGLLGIIYQPKLILTLQYSDKTVQGGKAGCRNDRLNFVNSNS